MYLSKAFDTLPRGLMIAKLKEYVISESACKFISSYPSSRQQRVKVVGDKEEWQYLKRWVHQGSVLGPLFLIYSKMICFIFLLAYVYYIIIIMITPCPRVIKM